MNIKFQGFELSVLRGSIDFDDLVAWLQSNSGKMIRFAPFDRMLCLDIEEDSEYYLGLFVSIKDQKRFCEIREQNGTFELVSKDLDEGASIADFNFFVIHKETKRGIYQYYHQSCSLRQFLSYLERQFLNLKRKSIKENYRDNTINDEERNFIRERIAASQFRSNLLMRSEEFDKLLDELSSIKEIKFDVATYEANDRWFMPLTQAAKKRTERVIFRRNLLGMVKKSIREFVRQDVVNNVSVKGISSETGIETTIKMFNNMADFGLFDYDELTEHFAVEIRDFTSSRILELVRTAAEDNSHIIGN